AESRLDVSAENPDGNMDRQIERLTKLLTDLPPEEVRDFDRHFAQCMYDAYRWDLWAAAYIIEGGCSDDGFMDFRSWLISMGHDVYERALADSESLVDHAADPTVEVCAFEELQYVASKVHGDPMDHGLEHPAEPSGEPWEEEGDDLERRFPRLWAKFADE
ncbi:hypothetical protein LCGC14_2810190, partial [marine sediment metagenome]